MKKTTLHDYGYETVVERNKAIIKDPVMAKRMWDVLGRADPVYLLLAVWCNSSVREESWDSLSDEQKFGFIAYGPKSEAEADAMVDHVVRAVVAAWFEDEERDGIT